VAISACIAGLDTLWRPRRVWHLLDYTAGWWCGTKEPYDRASCWGDWPLVSLAMRMRAWPSVAPRDPWVYPTLCREDPSRGCLMQETPGGCVAIMRCRGRGPVGRGCPSGGATRVLELALDSVKL